LTKYLAINSYKGLKHLTSQLVVKHKLQAFYPVVTQLTQA